MEQLSMILEDLSNLPEVELSPEYHLRCCRDGDEERWIKLISNVFGYASEAAESSWQEIIQSPYFQPEDVIFICCGSHVVATATARLRETDPTGTGYLHMVAADPAHKGKKLGAAVVAAVCRRLKYRGMLRVLLHTDDFRIPAISTYLKLGFRPVIKDIEMKNRWAELAKTLNMPLPDLAIE